MKPFLNEHFLLSNQTAQTLYHDYAKDLPIIDYHCHLSPQEMAENRQFDHLTAAWLEGDHYKWRAMRTLGIPERFITGDASDREKFHRWAEAVPYTMRNPLYHWTHLELQRYFEVTELLDPDSADRIYDHCGERLSQPAYHVRGLVQSMGVEVICTTDDPIDRLEHHAALKESDFPVKVIPAFRPDKCLAVGRPDLFRPYLQRLGEAADREIRRLDDLFKALEKRLDYFDERGCKLSDHGLEYIPAADFTLREADVILQRGLSGEALDQDEIDIYSSAVLQFLSQQYHQRGWTQQFHLGALRNNNSRMARTLGPDTGFDSIGDWPQAVRLSKFLDRLDAEDRLTKTIIYNLNPGDNEIMATMIGNFNDGSTKGKIQFGSGWWFLDQKDGMEKQMNALSNMGMLSCFVGMLTDSRSFLSFPRHEYFRRILCNLFGVDVENGELPNDLPWIGGIISDICYGNAKSYFNF